MPVHPPAGTDPTPPAAVSAALPAVAPQLEVSGGDLPAAIVEAYLASGGDLVDPAEWAGRFAPIGLPEIVGRGVKVVEATRQADWNGDGAGWRRTDEVAWLLIDDRGRDGLLDDLATRAGLADWDVTAAETVDNGANCVERRYTTPDASIEWTLHGCDYPLYPAMLAAGVSRVGVFTDPPAPADPTVPAVTDALTGVRLHSTRTVFGQPAPGSTSTVSTTVTLVADGLDIDAATATLTGGPLAGWQTFGGDASALLSGPSGATWTIAPDVVTFDSETRW